MNPRHLTDAELRSELEPCPGCARESTRVIGGPGTAAGPQFWAGCDYCLWRAIGNTESEAIELWNKRAPTPRRRLPFAIHWVLGLIKMLRAKRREHD